MITGDDLPSEFNFIDGADYGDHSLKFGIGEEDDGSTLGHCFDDEDSGHDGKSGIVSLEMRFIDRDIFDAHAPLARLNLNDAVDHEDRVAVGEIPHDFLDIHSFQNEIIMA